MEPSVMESWSLTLLGGFELRPTNGAVVDLPGQKDRALLAVLAMAAGDAHSRERLAGLLWSEHGDRQARDSLKQALVRLRRCVGGVEGGVLRTDRQTIALDRTAVEVDVLAFERLVAAGSLDSLARAMELYRGDLLEGISIRDPAFEDWLLVERQRLGQLFERALAGLMAQALTAGDRERAAEAARRLLQIDPLSEAAYRTLMQVHADEGQTSRAIKLYKALRDRLHREMGIQPEPETKALCDRIRARQTPPPQPAAESLSSRPEPTPSDKVAIAVLPFANMSEDADQEYFADGLTEDIIAELSRASALSVVARHTAFTFKGRTLHLQQVARELNVAYLLEGSVRKADGSVRVTAQLVDGATGDHRWAHHYDRRIEDIFALQDEISQGIVDVLKVTLLPGELETITRHPTANTQAYEYYLMGRSFYLRGMDSRCLGIAHDMYAKATEIDPDYARAYAGLAICDSYMAATGPGGSFESALANSARALALEPKLAEAHAAKGLALYAAVRFDEAAVEFERAMALDPGLFEAHFFHGRNCRNQGRHAEAAALFARAAELRPYDFRSPGLYAWECKVLGRHEEFAAALRPCLARVEAEIKAHPDNADALAFGSSILVALGDATRAEDWAARAVMLGPGDHVVQYNVALTNAMLGKIDAALDRLELAFSASPAFRRRLAAWLKYDQEMDALRDHPRFRSFAEAVENGGTVAAEQSGSAAAAPAAKPAIAVLPFLNLSGDPEQRYYSDGISEDITTGLSRFRSLLVIARNSAFQYRDRAVDVRIVARDLGVHYVVEGSVRKADDRIRVSVQLIDAMTGNHLWAQQYDHELSNLFTVQDEVTQTIVATLEGRIAAGAAARARRKPTQHMDAYDYMLQARDLMARYDLAAAEPLLARAIAADPIYAEAYGRHAYVSLSRYWADQDSAALNEAAMLAQKALVLDADDDWSNFAMGSVRLSMRQFDQAGSHYERILAANPNNVACATIFAELLIYVGRPVEALRQLDETMRRDPFPPNWYWEIRGMALFCLGRYDEAVAAYSKMTILHPWIQAYLVAAYVHAGRRDDADRQLTLYRGEHPGGSLLEIAKQEPYKDDKLRDPLIEGLQSVLPASEGVDRGAIRDRPTTVALVTASPAGEESPLDPAVRKLSIAVLPFTNMSGDPDQEYFADGLTEDIITDLSQVSALFVVARHTAFTFKGKTLQVQQVARDLKVDYVLEGSVRKSDGHVRITAQLIDGASGDHRWAHRYDRRFDDIFALQDEISKSIVDVLRVTLLPAELETITRHPTANTRAYEYYLMGRSFYLRGQGKRHLAIARDMYAKAAEIDPDYARAYAGMAICDSYEAASHPDGSFETALANSERALALDANLAEAYAAKGFALFAAVRFDEAAVEFERATRLDAGLFEAHFFHARNCHNQGLRAEAAALFARAAELRPSDFRSPGLLAWECKALGRREQCDAALRRCLARLEAEVKAHPDNADALVFGSSILVESGDSARAEDWVARAIILGPDDRFVQYNAALTNAMLGRMDAALDHLEQAFSASPTFRRRLAAWMKYDGEMDSLRDHARFQALLADLDAGGATVAERPAPASAESAAERKAPPAAKPSIAVLPFTNMSGDPEQQYFSDGITDDIITELSRFRTLFVIARNSSFQYRGGALDMVRIGRDLGVRYLCEGSVRRIGERVRVAAQLIEAASGTHLWGENFDRDAADILTVQDDIVRAIATTLGYRVEAAGRERALRLSPQALSAYDLMLRSEALMLRHGKADNAEAQRLAKQAVELDPKSALAHAQLGWTYCLDRIFGWAEESGEPLATALALAQRAVLLDETDCRARWLLGHVHVFRREYDEARAHLQTAIALNPNDVEAHGVYGIYLYAVGETVAALEQFDIARRHNPFEFNWIILCRGVALFTARRYDEAVATLKQVHNPTNEVRLWLAASYAGAGCVPEAQATLAEFLAVAERDMAQFPGRKLADWRLHLHRFVEYRDLREFDHLAAALQAAGLE